MDISILTNFTDNLLWISLQHMKLNFPGMVSPSSVAIQFEKGNTSEFKQSRVFVKENESYKSTCHYVIYPSSFFFFEENNEEGCLTGVLTSSKCIFGPSERVLTVYSILLKLWWVTQLVGNWRTTNLLPFVKSHWEKEKGIKTPIKSKKLKYFGQSSPPVFHMGKI